jgi:hypothetical protein
MLSSYAQTTYLIVNCAAHRSTRRPLVVSRWKSGPVLPRIGQAGGVSFMHVPGVTAGSSRTAGVGTRSASTATWRTWSAPHGTLARVLVPEPKRHFGAVPGVLVRAV